LGQSHEKQQKKFFFGYFLNILSVKRKNLPM